MNNLVKKHKICGPIILFVICISLAMRFIYLIVDLNADYKIRKMREQIGQMSYQKAIDAGYDKYKIIEKTIQHRKDLIQILSENDHDIQEIEEKCELDGEANVFTQYRVESCKNDINYEVEISIKKDGINYYGVSGKKEYEGEYDKSVNYSVVDIEYVYKYLNIENAEMRLKESISFMKKNGDDFYFEIADHEYIYLLDEKLNENTREFNFLIEN